MLIGYMRVSTSEQNLDLQRDGLERAGCEKIFETCARAVQQNGRVWLKRLRSRGLVTLW